MVYLLKILENKEFHSWDKKEVYIAIMKEASIKMLFVQSTIWLPGDSTGSLGVIK